MNLINAEAALERARKQLERVQAASWDPQDPVEAVTWAFYADENAVVATAEAVGRSWEKNHRKKAILAESLSSEVQRA